MELRWHSYRYYPYERELAIREILTLFSVEEIIETLEGIQLKRSFDPQIAERLVYLAEASDKGHVISTLQAKLEQNKGKFSKRQSTRYSVHGLHEYKGKFNPQIARAILNILHIPIGARILDPFCGSGTSLVECAHLGMKAIGTDINPLAIFIANAKLSALRLPIANLRQEVSSTIKRYKSSKNLNAVNNERRIYLEKWFDPIQFQEIEKIKAAIERGQPSCVPPLLLLASNLLRDYSLQDPHDLRIRRRKIPLPTTSFIEAFENASNLFLSRLEDTQNILPRKPLIGKAILLDSRTMKLGHNKIGTEKFDCALTSPPYATALPYIDTQRLSLVWLGLLSPTNILTLESRLVGSREVRGEYKRELLSAIKENRNSLPKTQVEYCRMLQASLSDNDGFRRQAVPMLLYRYFADMAKVFKAVRICMKEKAPFALIVGSNQTVLSGKRFIIETAQHLAQIAHSCGWNHEETVPLQTYQRYGYHMNNAINSEGLILLRAQ